MCFRWVEVGEGRVGIGVNPRVRKCLVSGPDLHRSLLKTEVGMLGLEEESCPSVWGRLFGQVPSGSGGFYLGFERSDRIFRC